jgi:hypothetical protein
MLNASDEPIIRRALTRRLDNEPGVKVLEIKVQPRRRHIAVGLLLHVDDKIIVRSVFDLPLEFELRHVHNEADEIAEGCKQARRTLRFTGPGLPNLGAISEEFTALGTGRRGNWRMYGSAKGSA